MVFYIFFHFHKLTSEKSIVILNFPSSEQYMNKLLSSISNLKYKTLTAYYEL